MAITPPARAQTIYPALYWCGDSMDHDLKTDGFCMTSPPDTLGQCHRCAHLVDGTVWTEKCHAFPALIPKDVMHGSMTTACPTMATKAFTTR